MHCLDREIQARVLARLYGQGLGCAATHNAARIMSTIDHKRDREVVSLCMTNRNLIGTARAGSRHFALAYHGQTCREIVLADCDMDPARAAVWPDEPIVDDSLITGGL